MKSKQDGLAKTQGKKIPPQRVPVQAKEVECLTCYTYNPVGAKVCRTCGEDPDREPAAVASSSASQYSYATGKSNYTGSTSSAKATPTTTYPRVESTSKTANSGRVLPVGNPTPVKLGTLQKLIVAFGVVLLIELAVMAASTWR